MKIKLFSLFLLSILGACSSTPSVEKEAAPTVAPVDEDDLLTRLSMQLVANPQTQAQKDQNLIVNYAIGALLDVKSTPSGLFYNIVAAGQSEDQAARWGDVIYIHYRGSLLDGTVFDQSKAGKPLRIKLREVILGWQEAIPLLRKEGKGIFLIPSHLAYGEKGFGKLIPPNTVLKFEMELVDIDRY